MDRVFRKSKINDICDDLKDIVKECKDHLEDIKDTANEANSAAAKVPSEASSGAVTSATSSFTSAAGDIDFQSLTTKLSNCKTRVGMIISQDKSYGADTDSIKAQINTVKQVLAQMEGFMGKTSLTVNYADFMASLETASTQWQKDLDNAKQAVDQIKANMKGAETISTIFSKDPVNLSTGNFIYDRTDLQIEGSTPFIFRRFYNAINDRSGSLGDDWNHNYELRLEDAGKEKVLILEEGKEERFLKTSTGIYASLYHSNGSLEETGDGYLYKNKDQTCYYFDKEGFYLRQETKERDITTLYYEETEKGKRLVKAERATGEAILFSYTDEGYLSQIVDHSGRAVTYQMQGAKLIGVCTPKGHWYRYGYSSNGKLESVQNPREVVTVENAFDEQLRTIHQKFPDGGSMSYEYDDENRAVTLIERNGNKVTYIHDEKYRDIKHIYRNGEERFEYNKLNQKTLVIDKLGNKTQYGYDEKGNLTRIINALGVKTELAYDEHNQPTYIAVDGKAKIKSRYDSEGNLTETIDALGNQYRIEYQGKGRPGVIIQPDGSKLTLAYDKRGNITELTDAKGSISRYTYDALNRVIKAVDGNGNETVYEYDEEDNIVSVRNAKGDTRRYEYNESNKVTKITDFDESEIKREYNSLNRPSRIIDQAGRETLLSYDPMWNIARVTEPNGAKMTFLYNEDNQLGRIRNANGDIIRYTYDANGNRTKITDEEGNETFFTYDALGQLIKVKAPEGSELSYTYDREGNIVKVSDALGNTAEFSYDNNGNLIKEMGPSGEERAYSYTVLGKVASMIDERGRETRYSYESGGSLKEVSYPDGTIEAYTYDRNRNVKTYTDKRGYTLTYTYDSLDQVVRISGNSTEEGEKTTAGVSESKEYTYDSIGNVTSMTDGAGNKTVYEYSLTGQLKKVIDALGNETEYSYDVCDRLIEIRQYGEEGSKKPGVDQELKNVQTQNLGGRDVHVTKYERDLSGRITAITDALGQKETYRYNKKGELLEKVDKEGYLTKYGYTAHGDVSDIRYADGREVKLSYNPLRQLQRIEDWLGVTKIENDAVGRATKVVYPDGREVGYTYGRAGEKTSVIYPDGKEVRYGYDEQLRLSALKDGNSVITYGYNEQGDLISKKFPNGMETAYAYDQKGQLTSLVHKDQKGVLDSYTYQYDVLGNKTSIEKTRRDLPEESGLYTYGYDTVGRLQEVTKDGHLQRLYGYDAFGNRSSKQESGATTHYTYNLLNQLVFKVDSQMTEAYQYDKRGNLFKVLEQGNIKDEYIYGALNRLEEVRNQQGEIARYQYNGLGHRIGKQIGTMASSAIQNEASLDPLSRIKEQTFEATSQIDYTIDLTKEYYNLLQTKENQTTQTYLWDDNVAVMIEQDSQAPLYYLQDDLGSPIRLLNEQGLLEEHYGYDEFGQELYQNPTKLQPFGFTGYQGDSIAGTYYAQAREYQSRYGRFVSEDLVKGIISCPLTLNHYTYCWNQPMDLVDFNGQWPQWMKDVGNGIKNTAKDVGNNIKDVANNVGNFVKDHKAEILSVAAIVGAGVFVGITGGLGAGIIAAGMVTTGGLLGGITNMANGGSFKNGFAGGATNTALAIVGVPNWGTAGIGSAVTTTFDNIDKGEVWYKGLLKNVGLSMTLASILPFDKLKSAAGIGEYTFAGGFLSYVIQVYETGVDVAVMAVEEIIKQLSNSNAPELCEP